MKDNNLIFGLGFVAGICGVFLVIELIPIIAIGGGAYLLLKNIGE